MIRKYLLPAAALLLFIYALTQALYLQRPEPQLPPPVSPSVSPFGHTVAGAGMVEPATEASGTGAIAVGTQVPGLVAAIHVHIDQEVKAGDLLFELDRRQTDADLLVRQAALENAEATLRRLERQPRPEEVPPSEAQVQFAEANVKAQKDIRDRDRAMNPGTVSAQDMVSHELAYKAAVAQLAVTQKNLALLKAGAWDADKLIACTAVKQARAQVEQDKTMLELLQVRAPASGTVLQLNVRPGEYVASAPGQTLVLMGSLRPIHVRVNVDEEDVPRLRLNLPARAKVRGDPTQQEIPMTFVRLEPYIVPKVSLTGVNTERVDTRVVQLIYALAPDNPMVKAKKVLVGQLLDVFIDTRAADPPSP